MSSNDPNIKQVRVIPGAGVSTEDDTEDAVLQGGAQTRKKGRAAGGGGRAQRAAKTYKLGSLTKEGGGAMSPGTVTQLSASHVPGAASAAAAASALGVDSALTQKGAPVGGGSGAATSTKTAAQPMQTGGEVKVVLAAPKKKGKVLLAAAAAPKAAIAAAPKTRKVRGARKIRVSMSSLSKKIHRAKTIRHKATEDSIADIKRTLHKAGLIKADSKAPEAVLRQMYADFMTLKNRAL